jgi:hypothetical protein
MLYKFKSPACGDVIMLEPNGDQLLRLLGREPAPKGIIETAAMPAALLALQAAIDADETPTPPDGPAEVETAAAERPHVSLRQRLWPMMDMLRRSHSDDAAVVWGA